MNVRVAPSALLIETGPATDTALLTILRDHIGDETVTSWFGRLQVEKIEGGWAVVSQPTNFLRSWTVNHYTAKLLEAVRVLAPAVEKVDVVLRSTAMRSVTEPKQRPALVAPIKVAPRVVAAVPAMSAKPSELVGFQGSALDRRLTFETFHSGPSNRMAHAAAQRIGEAEYFNEPTFNPLYVHGAVGLGKTHLLQAVAHAGEAKGRRVLYMSAEKFMYGFVAAQKAMTSAEFRAWVRDLDLLLVDDVQFLQGKAVQHEFCNTVIALLDARKQVVIAADRSPVELEAIEERARSRLGGGLCVEIGALDQDIRIELLKARVASATRNTPGLVIPDAVIAYVASVVQTNGRDLDGAVNRLIAEATFTRSALTVVSATKAIRDLVRMREPKRVKIDDIQKLVAAHYNVNRSDILSQRRSANVVRPRQIAMYLAKVMTLRSLPEIGRRFGGRDHTTVLHAVRKMEGLTGSDPVLDQELKNLRSMLEDA